MLQELLYPEDWSKLPSVVSAMPEKGPRSRLRGSRCRAEMTSRLSFSRSPSTFHRPANQYTHHSSHRSARSDRCVPSLLAVELDLDAVVKVSAFFLYSYHRRSINL